MKTLLALFALLAAVMAVAVLAVVQILIKLAPVLILIAVVVLVMKAIRGRHRPPAAPPMRALPPGRAVAPVRSAPPSHPVGWAPTQPGGWVLLPVWMGPPPMAWRPAAPMVVDAEVIEDQRRG